LFLLCAELKITRFIAGEKRATSYFIPKLQDHNANLASWAKNFRLLRPVPGRRVRPRPVRPGRAHGGMGEDGGRVIWV